MTLIQIDVDDDALTEAMQLMGTTSKSDAVNTALREYAALIKRREAATPSAERVRGT